MGARARITPVTHRDTSSVSSSSLHERAALVGLTGGAGGATREDALAELARLVMSAGATVVLRVTQDRPAPDAARFLGRGKVAQLAAACAELNVDVVIVDQELSPVQLRNLEQLVDRKVIDRTQLILDIFARRARSREGKLQVELAQLEYLLPRLVGAGTVLSRLGAGIGTRGPGETKLETDRRKIRRRIASVSREIDHVRRRRSQVRARRHKQQQPTVALVGYTNAGKTTLFNLLTGAAAATSDALFVTLDPVVRRARLPDRRALLLSDTVGFLDRLPHTLVAAFRATLEEVAEADLLLHVCDAASPDWRQHGAAVRRVLEDVGAEEVPCLTIFNKCDLLSRDERKRLQLSDPTALCASAFSVDSRTMILEAVKAKLAWAVRHVTLDFDLTKVADQRRMATVYRDGRVLRHRTVGDRVRIEAEVPVRTFALIAPRQDASVS